MSDEPVSPPLEESDHPPRLGVLRFRRYVVLFFFILAVSITAAVIFLQPSSWLTFHAEGIESLKNQVADLDSRLDKLESTRQTPSSPPIDPKQIASMDARLTGLYEQVESLRNQPRADNLPQPLERPLVAEKTLEKEIENLEKNQKAFKALLLFWRLKVKVLSEAPYGKELADFKRTANIPNGLKILEKYAQQGLQSLKEKPERLFFSSKTAPGSWWEQLKAMAASFVKIEKIDAPLMSSLYHERQTIEETLAEIEQTLTQQLDAIPGEGS